MAIPNPNGSTLLLNPGVHPHEPDDGIGEGDREEGFGLRSSAAASRPRPGRRPPSARPASNAASAPSRAAIINRTSTRPVGEASPVIAASPAAR